MLFAAAIYRLTDPPEAAFEQLTRTIRDFIYRSLATETTAAVNDPETRPGQAKAESIT
ncbi:hypothetical protein DFR69_109231 [Nocardia neocaledoniensis]|uniref:Uncharacterized protein n=2 Tax=Nocardia neocaledoniensis TaxID=236511 RepID=A0A317NBE3_9NOCA|nr:hypothetical protein DFR69_109231 [Nocardia neocaledoniensis]